MFDLRPTLTVIGFGAFGKLIARLLAPYADVSIVDPSEEAAREARNLGYRVISHHQDIYAEIVVLAVPVPKLEVCLTRLGPHLRKGQLVLDVCSIKEEPARLMERLLPKDVEILATHPMFGPKSARNGIAGSQIVLCPIRGRRWRRIGAFLKLRLRLEVIITTPEEHDRQAALTQGLTHLLARALSTLGESPKIRTRSFDLMTDALALVANDAPEIFDAVTTGNRHVYSMCMTLSQTLSTLAPIPRETLGGIQTRDEAQPVQRS